MAVQDRGTSGVHSGINVEIIRMSEVTGWQTWWGEGFESYRVIAAVTPTGETELVVHPLGATFLGDWYHQTMSACGNLRWDESRLPHEDAKVTEWSTVSRMLGLLTKILGEDSPAPSLVPTDRGGVQAEWDRNGLYLEIEADPDGSVEFYVSGRGYEHEGAVEEEYLELLRECARLLCDAPLVGAV